MSGRRHAYTPLFQSTPKGASHTLQRRSNRNTDGNKAGYLNQMKEEKRFSICKCSEWWRKVWVVVGGVGEVAHSSIYSEISRFFCSAIVFLFFFCFFSPISSWNISSLFEFISLRHQTQLCTTITLFSSGGIHWCHTCRVKRTGCVAAIKSLCCFPRMLRENRLLKPYGCAFQLNEMR